MRKLLATLAIGGALAIGAPTDAQAQDVRQDGLVNVNVGDVTILEDVNVAVAANVVAQLCGINVGPLSLAVLGQAVAVDRSGRSRTICRVEDGNVTITQNTGN